MNAKVEEETETEANNTRSASTTKSGSNVSILTAPWHVYGGIHETRAHLTIQTLDETILYHDRWQDAHLSY